jgi:hypothetical protein
MQNVVKGYADKLRAEEGVNLQVRVSVNIGEVVVRSITTDQARTEYTPIVSEASQSTPRCRGGRATPLYRAAMNQAGTNIMATAAMIPALSVTYPYRLRRRWRCLIATARLEFSSSSSAWVTGLGAKRTMRFRPVGLDA